jgi:hypothetical protein
VGDRAPHVVAADEECGVFRLPQQQGVKLGCLSQGIEFVTDAHQEE